ncbi:hypothetical protein SADUNF_Sadunf16G0300500 [Salix dunnii]|uniref:Uncharacterized protein n=1 Tax=Salix dunnii TaxID=1413687 RepID=A0A835JB75_9ROSI|nr:hypothetical protein SADUNF_Sadunf16G0300500 [Salix dunnii]
MENTLKPGDVIQCRECGYRILYKKRTRRITSFSHKEALCNMRHAEVISAGAWVPLLIPTDSNESTSQRIHLHKSLQIEGKTAVVFSHQFMLPFHQDPLLLSRIESVPGSDHLASLPLNETSILVISAKNCSEVPLLLQSMSIEVDGGIERPCTLEHSAMDILCPASLVPGEEFKKVFSVIPEVESSSLDLGPVSLRWRGNSEKEVLSTSAATQEVTLFVVN